MKTENAAATLCLTTAMALVVMLCAHAPIAHSLPTAPDREHEPEEGASQLNDPAGETKDVAFEGTVNTESKDVALGDYEGAAGNNVPGALGEMVFESGRARSTSKL